MEKSNGARFVRKGRASGGGRKRWADGEGDGILGDCGSFAGNWIGGGGLGYLGER